MRTWTSRRRTGSACAPTTCRSAPTGKSSAARAWCRSSRRRVRCSGSWAPSCATRPRHGPARATSRRGRWPRCTKRRSGRAPRAVMTRPSWRRPPGRWSNPALSLPTGWSRPRISIDSGSWTQGPKSPLHQLSRHYRAARGWQQFSMRPSRTPWHNSTFRRPTGSASVPITCRKGSTTR